MSNSRKKKKKNNNETVVNHHKEIQEPEPLTREETEHLLDEAIEDSFPASDPPSTSPMTSLGRPSDRRVPPEDRP